MISELINFVSLLSDKHAKVAEQLERVASALPPALPSFYYDSPTQNMFFRKQAFLRRHFNRLHLKLLNTKLVNILIHTDEAQLLLSFLRNGIKLMHPDTAIRIKESFFVFRTHAPRCLSEKYTRLKAWLLAKDSANGQIDPPLYITNFSLYFDSLLTNGVRAIDKNLGYSPPLPEETNLSRSIFSNRNNTKTAEEIDAVVDIGLSGDTENFVSNAITLALALVPDSESRTPQEQSVGLMMFYRVIFDRLYERTEFAYSDGRQPLLIRLSRLPLGLFPFPLDIASPADLASPISRYFERADPFISPAQCLLDAALACNPMDALFSVHRALLGIRQAAMNGDDLRTVLCFDDLFALLVGVLLASDLPDFFAMAEFVDKFVPKKISNSFQYAKMAVTALAVHFTSIDVEALERKANEDTVRAA
jgi:hypothetical protein